MYGTSTTFSRGSIIPSGWLNDVNALTYGINGQAGQGGTGLIGFDGDTLAAFFLTRSKRVVDSVAGLQLLSSSLFRRAFVTGYYAVGDGGGGEYWCDTSDTTSTHNGGTVIVAADGARWKLIHDGTLSVKQFGAKGDGVTDDATRINACYAAVPQYGTVRYPAGVYVIGAQLTVVVDNIKVTGKAKILAKAGAQFENMMLATSRTGVTVEDLEFDANKANRSAGQTVRFMGLVFTSCIDCTAKNVTVRNTRGYSSIPGVGLTLGGACTRCTIDACRLIDCGDAAPNASDGVFTSGTQNIICNSQAINCTDTGFVLESSNAALISGCTAMGCSAGGAITNATSTDKRSNMINGLIVVDWNASNTGGIQIGVPTATAGNLLDTVVNGVSIGAGAGFGTGAAINVRQQGSGRAIGLVISGVRVNGATTQGVLVDGDDALVSATAVKGTTNAGIQFQDGTIEGYAVGNKIKGGSFGVATNGTGSAIAKANACLSQTSKGIVALQTSTMRSVFNTVLTPTSGYEDKDAGATLIMIGHRDGYFALNQITASAPAGSLNKRSSVFDNTGTPSGALAIYS